MAKQKPSNKELLEAVQFHPFFQGLDSVTALSLMERCDFRIYEKNSILLHGQDPRIGLILVLDGMAEVLINEGNEVLEVVQKGELIGFSGLADCLGAMKTMKAEVSVEVQAGKEVEALFIPFEVITKRLDDPAVRNYLLTQVSARLKDVYGSLAEQVKLAHEFGEEKAFMTRVQDVMAERVVSITPKSSVQEAAKTMAEERTSSVLVIENEKLCGIITEKDMVGRVVAKGLPHHLPAKEIMTKNPIVISPSAYYYDAISLIFSEEIKHLPVVEDGKVMGMVTLSDLLRKKNESVMTTIKKIQHADESELSEVKEAVYSLIDLFLREKIPIFKTLEMTTKLLDRLVIRAVELAVRELKEEGYAERGPFSFYVMGSSGRGEQFMLTDQDHFLVYDSNDHDYFRLLGGKITNYLEKAGYERCKGLMMCSEANWRGNLIEWQNRLRTWMLHSTNTNLLLAQNFFSYRFLFGSEDLHMRFEKMVEELLHGSKIFLYRLAQLEREHPIPDLDQPIRSLFKLERKSMDLKKEALFPYHHSLQILALLHGIPTGTPLEKIDALLDKGVVSPSFVQDVKDAVEQLLSLYIKQRRKQARRGEELTANIPFFQLSTKEKEALIWSLKVLRELQNNTWSNFSI